FSFADKQTKDDILNKGLWLEHFVYSTIDEIGGYDDLQAGIQFSWAASDRKVSPRNELDVICSRSSQLYCISCKAGSNLDMPKILNEIKQYSEVLGGIFYKAALVLTEQNI